MEQKSNKKAYIIGGIAVSAVVFIISMMWVTYTNQEVTLRTRVETEQEVCKNHFDNMWKIIHEQAGVAEKYAEDFERIFPKIMEERYGNERGGALLSFITESNPNFDISLYSTVQKSIQAERTGFTAHQDKLLDVNQAHKNLLRKIPSKFFLASAEEIKVIMVTSSKTKAAYESGEDNDTELFKKQ